MNMRSQYLSPLRRIDPNKDRKTSRVVIAVSHSLRKPQQRALAYGEEPLYQHWDKGSELQESYRTFWGGVLLLHSIGSTFLTYLRYE